MFVKIIDDVREWLAFRGIDAVVSDGPEALNEQLNYSESFARVVFVPTSGPLAIEQPTHIGEDEDDHRQLLNMMYAFDVAIAAYDATEPERLLAHHRMVVGLFEAVVQALQRSYYGAHVWGPATWRQPRKNLSHGAELAVALTLNIPLFDVESLAAAPSPVPGEPKPVT